MLCKRLSPIVPIITVEELAAFAKTDEDDPRLNSAVLLATKLLERYLERDLIQTDRRCYFDHNDRSPFRLYFAKTPQDVVFTVDTIETEFDLKYGSCAYIEYCSLFESITIDYVSGMSDTVEEFVEAYPEIHIAALRIGDNFLNGDDCDQLSWLSSHLGSMLQEYKMSMI